MSIQWSGIREMQAALDRYADAVLHAVEQVALYFEPVLEGYAKSEARWTDQTGNARQALHTWHELADDVVILYLAHGMDYGIWLEVRWAGRYAILWPTIEAHLNPVATMLQEIFR